MITSAIVGKDIQTIRLHYGYPDRAEYRKPTVAALALQKHSQFLTFALPRDPYRVKYVIAGTDYGLLRDSFGNIRMFRTARQARNFLLTYAAMQVHSTGKVK